MLPPSPVTWIAHLALLVPPTPVAVQDTPAPAARSAEASPQTESPPLPPGVAALIDGQPLTFAEYGEYLLELSGRRPLEDLIDQRLMEQAAERAQLAIDAATVDAAVLAEWQDYLDQRHKGVEARALEELAREGLDKQTYLAGMRRRAWREALVQALCIHSRVVTEERVQELFEQQFGTGGVRVVVRHIALNRARTRKALLKRGVPAAELNQARLDAELQDLARTALALLDDGAVFADVAGQHSHDVSAKNTGGLIPGYNYLRYGPDFAAAVRAAQVGVVVGPVVTDTGLHILLVESRVTTQLEDVREELVALVESEPATHAERQALQQRLRAEAEIRTY